MRDIFHDTLFVDKLIHYAGKRVYRYKPLSWQNRKMRRQCAFLDDKDKEWFEKRLDYATVEVKDIDDAKTLADANLAMSGKIEVVGGDVDVSGQIDWHTDFKNGYSWPKGLHYSKFQIIGPQGGRDVKTVWDLSRCHHLLWLAAAYRQTHEERYVNRIVETIDDWIAENTFGRSVNWVCPMDVAIRAVNWMFAVRMVMQSENVRVDFLRRLFMSLYQHAAFIFAYPEKSDPFSENHYASDIAGLLFIGYLFDCEKQGRAWLGYALQAMLYEMRTQVLPSGAHFERSLSYHRLVTELFLYSYLIIRKNTPSYVAIDLTYRLQSMVSFIASYTKPSGYAPLLADNDNGRFLPFVKRDYREHYYVIDLARLYGIMDKPCQCELFADAGFAFLSNDNYYLSFTNTPASRYSRPWRAGSIGTHTHLDALSIELSKGKDDFIVDPGTYAYTLSKEIRTEFRSMRKHNTMTVDDEDPYMLSEDFGITVHKGCLYQEPEPVSMTSENHTKILKSGVLWEKKEVLHERTIDFSKGKVEVIDSVQTKEFHDFQFRYHLNAGVEVAEQNTNGLILKMGNSSLTLGLSTDIPMSIEVANDTISPAYGVLLDAKTIIVKVKSDKDFIMKSLFK